MIIVEGPDGSGKTRLVSRLSEELGVKVEPRACSSEHGVNPDELRRWVERDLLLTSRGKLYDRHPLISEPIYGPLIRGWMAKGFSDVFWLSEHLQILRLKHPLTIYCLPPWTTVESNIEFNHHPTTPHLRGVLLNARKIYELYVHRAALGSGDGLTWVWDYTSYTDREYRDVVELCREVM